MQHPDISQLAMTVLGESSLTALYMELTIFTQGTEQSIY